MSATSTAFQSVELVSVSQSFCLSLGSSSDMSINREHAASVRIGPTVSTAFKIRTLGLVLIKIFLVD